MAAVADHCCSRVDVVRAFRRARAFLEQARALMVCFAPKTLRALPMVSSRVACVLWQGKTGNSLLDKFGFKPEGEAAEANVDWEYEVRLSSSPLVALLRGIYAAAAAGDAASVHQQTPYSNVYVRDDFKMRGLAFSRVLPLSFPVLSFSRPSVRSSAACERRARPPRRRGRGRGRRSSGPAAAGRSQRSVPTLTEAPLPVRYLPPKLGSLCMWKNVPAKGEEGRARWEKSRRQRAPACAPVSLSLLSARLTFSPLHFSLSILSCHEGTPLKERSTRRSGRNRGGNGRSLSYADPSSDLSSEDEGGGGGSSSSSSSSSSVGGNGDGDGSDDDFEVSSHACFASLGQRRDTRQDRETQTAGRPTLDKVEAWCVGSSHSSRRQQVRVVSINVDLRRVCQTRVSYSSSECCGQTLAGRCVRVRLFCVPVRRVRVA